MKPAITRPLIGFLLVTCVVLYAEVAFPCEEACFRWALELSEAGLTTRVLQCSLSEAGPQGVVLIFDSGFDAAGFDGIEILARADRPAPISIHVVCGDPEVPTEMSEQGQKDAEGPVMLMGSSTRAYRIPFDRFSVPSRQLRDFPSVSASINTQDIRSILLDTSAAELSLEIHSVAFYRSVGSTEERTYVDQLSILSEDLKAAWYGMSCNDSECTWTPLDTDTTTTDSYWMIKHQGGTLEVVEDPTGSGRGLVTRATVPPRIADGELLATTGPIIEQWPGILVTRVYGFVLFPVQEPPCTTSVDIWVSQELFDTAVGATSGTVLLDVYDVLDGRTEGMPSWRSPSGDRVNSSLQAKLWTGSVHDGRVYLDLKWAPYADAVAILEPTAPEFTAEEWHTISISVGVDRNARLYQDGQLVSQHTLWQDFRGGTIGGHLGLYIHDASERGEYAVRGVVLYDNYQIACGPCAADE